MKTIVKTVAEIYSGDQLFIPAGFVQSAGAGLVTKVKAIGGFVVLDFKDGSQTPPLKAGTHLTCMVLPSEEVSKILDRIEDFDAREALSQYIVELENPDADDRFESLAAAANDYINKVSTTAVATLMRGSTEYDNLREILMGDDA